VPQFATMRGRHGRVKLTAMTVLVTAASRHGATSEIAVAIARVLGSRGLDADVRRADDVRELEGYDAVVLGSAVYAGKWLEPARRLVEEHGDELAARPTWLFSSGPLGEPPRPAPRAAVDVDAIAAATRAREHRLFAGRLDRGRLGLGERVVARAVHAPEGDFRDWGEIEAWADDIAATLEGRT